MKEPGDFRATDFERELLDAAMRDRIPAELKSRMAEALQVPLAGGAAATSAASSAGGFLLSKTVAVGVAATLLAGGAIGWQLLDGAAERQRRAAPPPSAARPVAPAVVDRAAVPTAAGTAHEVAAPAASAAAALRDEIVLLDASRRALKEEAPERALQLLARYEQRFPNGTLAPEAAALQIESLAQAGANQRARELARRFLAAYPTSPLAQGVERYVGPAH